MTAPTLPFLTKKSAEYLYLRSWGWSDADIADEYGVTVNAVCKALARAQRVLDARDLGHAMAIALRHNLIPVEVRDVG